MFDFHFDGADVVVHVHLAGEADVRSIKESLAKLIHLGDTLMTDVAELNSKLDALEAGQVAERAEWLQFAAEFKTQIQALKDQIAAGTPASQADLDALGARLDSALAKNASIVDAADKA